MGEGVEKCGDGLCFGSSCGVAGVADGGEDAAELEGGCGGGEGEESGGF